MTLRLVVVAPDEAALLGAAADDDALMALLEGNGSLDLDKMWDAVHSLFADGADPLFAGDPVTEDLGYGPATYVSPVEARRISAAIEGLTERDFAERFSPAQLFARGAYPNIWDRADEMLDAEREAVALAERVVGLYQHAATSDGILIAML
jgi:hypothetical protein